jgi:serpin B
MRKKIIAIILTAAMVLSLAIPASTTVTEPKASIQDALDILKFLAKLDSPVTGNATIEDALDILKYLARLDSVIGGQLPAGKTKPVKSDSVTTNATPSTTNATPSTTNATPSTTNATPSTTNATPSTTNATPSTTNATPSTTLVTEPKPVTPPLTPGQFTEFAPALMDLSMDVFKRSFAEDTAQNTLVSPLSILLALAMTANGADGQTLAEMEAVLGRGIKLQDLNAMLNAYVNNLPSAEGSKLNIANSIWVRNGFNVLEQFLLTNKKYYNAEIVNAPFDQGTVNDINKWVSDNTDGMIPKVLEFISDEIMFLINAIVFDSEWKNQYEEKDISKRDFTTADGRKQNTDFMFSNHNDEKLIKTDNATGFVKPYKGEHYSFAALLPNEGIQIGDFVAGLTADCFTKALETAHRPWGGMHARLPKFTFDYDITLNNILGAMGMPSAFNTATSNLSKIAEDLFISFVKHKTFIEVDERGTKAAAVTVIGVAPTSVPPPPVQVTFDRPFVFAIVDNSTDLPIFIGTLMEVPS